MIIKNGLVIDPASGLSEKMDLLIEDGIIKEMASLITKEGEEVLDAAGLVVAPGLIDTHVHFRDPGFTYKETIHTGALASAKGGFTSVICMANTSRLWTLFRFSKTTFRVLPKKRSVSSRLLRFPAT